MRRLCIADYPIDKLQPHPKNVYRAHDLDFLKELLRKGQHRTIAVRALDPAEPLAGAEVLAGYGVLKAATELGLPTVAASVVECSDDEALTLIVADNRANERGQEDDEALLELLSDINAGGGLAAAGYDDADLLALRHDDPPQVTAVTNSGGQPLVLQTLLNFPHQGDYDAFVSRLLKLRGPYGITDGGLSHVIFEAVKRQAAG